MTQAMAYTQTTTMPSAEELEGVVKHADEIITWLEDKEAFQKAIRYLRRQGIKCRDLAKLFGVTPITICYWQSGVRFPGYYPGSKNQRCVVIIRELAKCLREQAKAQKESGLKPQVSYS